MKEFGALAYPCEECDREDCEDREIGDCKTVCFRRTTGIGKGDTNEQRDSF